MQSKEYRTNTFNHDSSSQIYVSGNISSYSHEILHVTEQFKTSILLHNTTVILQLNEMQLLKLKQRDKRDEPGYTVKVPPMEIPSRHPASWSGQNSTVIFTDNNRRTCSKFSGGWK